MKRRELLEYVRERQVADWGRLATEISRAANGVWSVGAERVVEDLVSGIRLVGPCDPTSVQWWMYRAGIYEAVVALALTPRVDPDEAARMDEVLAMYARSDDYSAAVAAVRSMIV